MKNDTGKNKKMNIGELKSIVCLYAKLNKNLFTSQELANEIKL